MEDKSITSFQKGWWYVKDMLKICWLDFCQYHCNNNTGDLIYNITFHSFIFYEWLTDHLITETTHSLLAWGTEQRPPFHSYHSIRPGRISSRVWTVPDRISLQLRSDERDHIVRWSGLAFCFGLHNLLDTMWGGVLAMSSYHAPEQVCTARHTRPIAVIMYICAMLLKQWIYCMLDIHYLPEPFQLIYMEAFCWGTGYPNSGTEFPEFAVSVDIRPVFPSGSSHHKSSTKTT